jgi:hypothetical protein
MKTTTAKTSQRKSPSGDEKVEKKKTPPAFLEKLFDILEENAWEEMISWTNEGTSFIIKKVTEFSEIVLPRYFKHSNIQSCIRQLVRLSRIEYLSSSCPRLRLRLRFIFVFVFIVLIIVLFFRPVPVFVPVLFSHALYS